MSQREFIKKLIDSKFCQCNFALCTLIMHGLMSKHGSVRTSVTPLAFDTQCTLFLPHFKVILGPAFNQTSTHTLWKGLYLLSISWEYNHGVPLLFFENAVLLRKCWLWEGTYEKLILLAALEGRPWSQKEIMRMERDWHQWWQKHWGRNFRYLITLLLNTLRCTQSIVTFKTHVILSYLLVDF